MKDLAHYIDLAKQVTGSDRQTALRLGIEPGRIATARKKGQLGVELCTRLAEIAGVEPMAVIGANELMKHPEKKKFWAKWVAATVILSAGIMSNNAEFSGVYAASFILPAIYYAHIEQFALVLSLIVFYFTVRSKKLGFDYETKY